MCGEPVGHCWLDIVAIGRIGPSEKAPMYLTIARDAPSFMERLVGARYRTVAVDGAGSAYTVEAFIE